MKAKNIKNIKQLTTKDIDQLKYNLWKRLNQNKDLIYVDEVIIENQPSLKNPKIKSIAETILPHLINIIYGYLLSYNKQLI